MGYLPKAAVLRAYKELSHLTNDPSAQGATQATSALRYLFALDEFTKEMNKPCDTSNKDDRDKFISYVGNVVSINSDLYTANFFNAIKDNPDYAVGSNFFSVNTVKNSLINTNDEFPFPKRGNSPLFVVKGGVLIEKKDLLPNVVSFLHTPELRNAFAVWLVRNNRIDSTDIFGSIISALTSRYTNELIESLQLNEELISKIVGNSLIENPYSLSASDFPKASSKATTISVISDDNLANRVREAFIQFWSLIDQHGAEYNSFISNFENAINPELQKLDLGYDNIFQVVDIEQYNSVINRIVADNPDVSFILNGRQNNNGLRYEVASTHLHYKNYLSILNASSFLVTVDQEKNKRFKRQLENSRIQTPLDDLPLQQIFFGAPGTGKSHTINQMCASYENYRTTFHPDTDYAAFVGSYKPITETKKVYTFMGDKAIPVKDSDGKEIAETKITYRYVFQAFLKAYIAAWKEQTKENPAPVFLVIEEINRGNCAQIFGDIFQLLDRNESGFSDYPIVADDDLAKELRKMFDGIAIAQHEEINSLYKGSKDIVSEVLNGSHLLLPNNLYVWATMNTSDQSLFPIDSAFKRRWEWKYIKIKRAHQNYKIRFSNGNEYDWWQFVAAINEKIEGGEIQQEDKQLGYFFAKAKRQEDGSMHISPERFLSKVIFFLYQDVFKDFGLEEDFFKDDDGQSMTFASYFTEDGGVDENRVERFVRNVIGEENLALTEEETDDTILDGNVNPKLSVKFDDGEIINTGTQAHIYIESLKRIGLEKAAAIFDNKGYKLPLITKEPVETSDSARRYKQVDDWYVLLGPDVYPYYPKLQILNAELNLGLELTHK